MMATMERIRTGLMSAVLWGTLALSGCSHFTMHTAKDFVVLDDSYPYDFRATTPEGMVIGVRELDNKREHGELPFWSKAIENQLRMEHGYALLDTKDVTTKKGLRGTQMRFGLDREGAAHVYIVAVFVTKKRVFVVEAGGTEELVKRHQEQVDWSIAEFVAR